MNKLFYFILLLIPFVSSCFSHKKLEFDKNKNAIVIFQGNKSFLIKNHKKISLEPNEFKIQFINVKENYTKYDSCCIAKIISPKNLDKFKNIKNGTKTAPYGLFGGGDRLVYFRDDSYKNGLYIYEDEGYHGITYNKGVKNMPYVIKKNENNEELKFEYLIKGKIDNFKIIPFSELGISKMFLVIFIDRNYNHIIEKNELKTVEVNFKK